MNFSYPEFSPAFKLLYTFSNLSYSQFPSPVFEKNKEDNFYTCDLLQGIKLTLEETSFKQYQGVILEIKDFIESVTMKSKFMKADFITYDSKKGFKDFDNTSIKSLDSFYPSLGAQLVNGFHYCAFTKCTKKSTLDITIYPDSDLKKFRIGMWGASDLTIDDYREPKIRKALAKEYKKLWRMDYANEASKYILA